MKILLTVGSIIFANMLVLTFIGPFDWLVNFFSFHPVPGNQVNPRDVDPTIQEVFFDSSDGVTLQGFLSLGQRQIGSCCFSMAMQGMPLIGFQMPFVSLILARMFFC